MISDDKIRTLFLCYKRNPITGIERATFNRLKRLGLVARSDHGIYRVTEKGKGVLRERIGEHWWNFKELPDDLSPENLSHFWQHFV